MVAKSTFVSPIRFTETWERLTEKQREFVLDAFDGTSQDELVDALTRIDTIIVYHGMLKDAEEHERNMDPKRGTEDEDCTCPQCRGFGHDDRIVVDLQKEKATTGTLICELLQTFIDDVPRSEILDAIHRLRVWVERHPGVSPDIRNLKCSAPDYELFEVCP